MSGTGQCLQTFSMIFVMGKCCCLLLLIFYFLLQMRLQEFNTLRILSLILLILLKFISFLQIIGFHVFIILALAHAMQLFFLIQAKLFFSLRLQSAFAMFVFHFRSFDLCNLTTFILSLAQFIWFSLVLVFGFTPFQFHVPWVLILFINALSLTTLIAITILFPFLESPSHVQFFLLPIKAFILSLLILLNFHFVFFHILFVPCLITFALQEVFPSLFSHKFLFQFFQCRLPV